jgi:hypothetical protein
MNSSITVSKLTGFLEEIAKQLLCELLMGAALLG